MNVTRSGRQMIAAAAGCVRCEETDAAHWYDRWRDRIQARAAALGERADTYMSLFAVASIASDADHHHVFAEAALRGDWRCCHRFPNKWGPLMKRLRYSPEPIAELVGSIRHGKVPSFARALMGDGEAVVLDSWMAEACFDSIHVAAVGQKYEAAEDSWRETTAELVPWLSPRDAQALVWGHVSGGCVPGWDGERAR